MMAMDGRQLKIGLRVRDPRRSAELYLRLGFKESPNPDQPNLRYLTFGHTWLILSES
jgi:lactoylglutathione lyase